MSAAALDQNLKKSNPIRRSRGKEDGRACYRLTDEGGTGKWGGEVGLGWQNLDVSQLK